MDLEFLARMADLRRQTEGTSSTSSTPRASLVLLGSSASIASSDFSESFSIASLPPVVEFPPTPVFTDQIPDGFIGKFESLSIVQTPKVSLRKPHPFQNSHPFTATRSLNAHEHDEGSSSTTLSGQQQPPMKLPSHTRSVLHYTPPRQTPAPLGSPTTPLSISQQPSSLTSTSIPRTTNPLLAPPQSSNHSPPPTISLEAQHHLTSPPDKANIIAWWNQFILVNPLKEDPFRDPQTTLDTADHPVFGKPLRESLRYASVQISTANVHGVFYVRGSIPLVIAKCGLYLKENAREVPGIFSVNGSIRRMRDLQVAFESPPHYGKFLDWKKESYTTHDIASVFQRYLAQMPEPVIPHDMYHLFRDALVKEPFNQKQVTATYKSLIGQRMPDANHYLLLYVLDLLSSFAKKCDKNLMTATRLADIFCPSLISHPQHEMLPKEHSLNQNVLEFLLAQWDSWFMLNV